MNEDTKEYKKRRDDYEKGRVETYFKGAPKILKNASEELQKLALEIQELDKPKGLFSSLFFKDPVMLLIPKFEKLYASLREHLEYYKESGKDLSSWTPLEISSLSQATISAQGQLAVYKSDLSKLMTGKGTFYDQLKNILREYGEVVSSNKSLNSAPHP